MNKKRFNGNRWRNKDREIYRFTFFSWELGAFVFYSLFTESLTKKLNWNIPLVITGDCWVSLIMWTVSLKAFKFVALIEFTCAGEKEGWKKCHDLENKFHCRRRSGEETLIVIKTMEKCEMAKRVDDGLLRQQSSRILFLLINDCSQ